MREMKIALLCFSLLLFGRPGRTQDTPQEEPKTVFAQLFPHPTGQNGYEDLVMAGDLVRDRGIGEAQQPGATLEVKRKVLNDPRVKRALELIHIGLGKPILSPYDPEKMDMATVFPQYADFRTLARILSIAQYVALADGKISPAIDLMQDGLQLGNVIQQETLISGLVGIAIDAIAVKLLAIKVNQLSFRDCERLERVCEEWLKMPSPMVHVLESERNLTQQTFKQLRTVEVDSLQGLIETNDADAEKPETPDEKALRELMQYHPEEVPAVLDKAADLTRNFYDALIEQAKREAWDRKSVPLPKEIGPAGAILSNFLPSMNQVLDKYDQDRANLHLLGTYAALHRYRWIYDRLPDTLRELRIPSLTLDPFTGETLLYHRTGDTYDLYSAGPLSYDEQGHQTKSRHPFYLPYRKDP